MRALTHPGAAGAEGDGGLLLALGAVALGGAAVALWLWRRRRAGA